MQIKLIIWDLDDTLWQGTLAEGDEVALFHQRADFIRALNSHGIVSSICSKNDFDKARATLERLNLWDQFVFAHIDFTPKAEAVRQIIKDMQLRPVNVLFVDDNIHNLEEVRYALPELNIIDASQPACDALLAKILEDNKHVGKSRVEEYRMLEKKRIDQKLQSSSNEDFLRSCDIHVAVVYRADNMGFSERIEELINRSNQLNYTKSRVEPGSMTDLLASGYSNYAFSVFVWDKYGYHGLVGFALTKDLKTFTHFVFSCRVMNMGIENWLLNYIYEFLKKQSIHIDVSQLPIIPRKVDWIQGESYRDPAICELIWKKEKDKELGDVQVRILAQCGSGGLAHYSGLGNRVDNDGLDRIFNISLFLDEKYRQQSFPPMLVYTSYSDYDEKHWEALNAVDRYKECAIKFCSYIRANNKKLLVILTPQDLPPERQSSHRRAGRARMAYCNNAWRDLADIFDEVSLLEVADIAVGNEVIDNYHYDVPLLKKLGEQIRRWFDAEQSLLSGQPTRLEILCLTVPDSMDNIDFVEKIEELITSPDQLNYTSSCVDPGSLFDTIINVAEFDSLSVFAWDKNNYYGLAGFMLVERATQTLVHFVFSSRVAHMGIENFMLNRMKEKYPNLNRSNVKTELPSLNSNRIQEERFLDGEARTMIMAKEFPGQKKNIALRVMFECQSAGIAHYSRWAKVMEFDNWPRAFRLSTLMTGEYLSEKYPPMLVYGAGAHYRDSVWPDAKIDKETYRLCVEKLCIFVEARGSTMLVFLPPQNASDDKYHPFAPPPVIHTRERAAELNSIWRECVQGYSNITLLELDDLIQPHEMRDASHYYAGFLQKIAGIMDDWYEAEKNIEAGFQPLRKFS